MNKIITLALTISMLCGTTTDYFADSQYWLNNTGYYISYSDAQPFEMPCAEDVDIDAPEGWAVFDKSMPEVIVAVIDTGIDYRHPDLAESMWVNAGEIPDNGIDDDGNGYIDDIYGWDFYNNDATVCHYEANEDDGPDIASMLDNDNHGTHCAGIIAAVHDNDIGIAGVASVGNVKIMSLKVHGGANRHGTVSDAIKAIRYAEQMGASVCNMSWGSYAYSQALYTAMSESNMLFVCAAGNDGINTDEVPLYPACFDLDNVISVTALSSNGQLSHSANYGANSVDVAVPANDILSTVVGSYATMSGSSMAAPQVSGMAALIYEFGPGLSPEQVKEVILNSVKPINVVAVTDENGEGTEPIPEDEGIGEESGEGGEDEVEESDAAAMASGREVGRGVSELAMGFGREVGRGVSELAMASGRAIGRGVAELTAASGREVGRGVSELTMASKTNERGTTDTADAVLVTYEKNGEKNDDGDSQEEFLAPGPIQQSLIGKLVAPGIPSLPTAVELAKQLIPIVKTPNVDIAVSYSADGIEVHFDLQNSDVEIRQIRYMVGTRSVAGFKRGTGGNPIGAGNSTLVLQKQGTYSFYILDKYGNEATKTLRIMDDIVAPTIECKTVEPVQVSTNVGLSAIAYKMVAKIDDSQSGIKSVKVLEGIVDSKAFKSSKVPSLSLDENGLLNYTLPGQGSYTIYACDNRGNVRLSRVMIYYRVGTK